MVEVINLQKEEFNIHSGGLSLTNDEFLLNSIVNRLIVLRSLAFAAVFKGEIHQSAVSDDFAVFNLKIQFLDFRYP